ncbi:MAG: tetratricopeptide repeat protein [Oscillospiraceae bacterium]|nr:tetratricopeptide repeat protein [Oscillospiraceae bacterium]
MKLKILFALNILIIVGMAVIIVYQLFIAEATDYKLLAKAGTLFIVYLLGVLGIKRKRSPLDFTVYQSVYGFIIKKAFSRDRVSYMGLMKAITLYNESKFDKAIKKLDKLEEKCTETDDFSAVLYFRALCKDESGNKQGAIADYEELLTRDYTHSHAWSNLGLLYEHTENADKAHDAYEQAVYHDSKNHIAQHNLGNSYLKKAEFSRALDCAVKALEVNPKFAPAMSLAAVSCKFLGDNESAEKYCKMYGKHGCDAARLRKVL